jgi:hypothetical protein
MTPSSFIRKEEKTFFFFLLIHDVVVRSFSLRVSEFFILRPFNMSPTNSVILRKTVVNRYENEGAIVCTVNGHV